MGVARNAAASFGTPPSGTDPDALSHFVVRRDGDLFLVIANTGTGDQDPDPEQEITIPANMAVLNFPRGVFTEAAWVEHLQAGFDAVAFTVSAHDGAPGSNGSANEYAGSWYSRPNLVFTVTAA